jgi:hypothetical protein
MKPAISTAGSTAGRQSLCQPHSPQIEAAVGAGLSTQRITGSGCFAFPLMQWKTLDFRRGSAMLAA